MASLNDFKQDVHRMKIACDDLMDSIDEVSGCVRRLRRYKLRVRVVDLGEELKDAVGRISNEDLGRACVDVETNGLPPTPSRWQRNWQWNYTRARAVLDVMNRIYKEEAAGD